MTCKSTKTGVYNYDLMTCLWVVKGKYTGVCSIDLMTY